MEKTEIEEERKLNKITGNGDREEILGESTGYRESGGVFRE